ncbi:HU family DNA-binding protein [Vibrio parahaemolyticus]|uniref:HU family DNA-binding protein n=1 Tax=Vibrio parahaemolyticus TaxID=670 RepID=UPI0038928641
MTTRLNRTDIERNISKRLGLKLTGDDAELIGDCLDAMFNHMLVELAKGREVQVRGFGRLRHVEREHTTINPATKERLGVKTEHSVVFSAYKDMVRIHE